jgi:glycosyltransferase involved in cell wall biosynthesis
MKILLVTSFFPPTHTSGTEKRTLGYALKLHERGHDVQVVCAGTFAEGDHYWNGYSDEIYRQIPVRRINLNWILAPDPNQFLYCNSVIEKQFNQWLEEWNPDIVHITSCLTLSASVIQAAKAQQRPVVLTLTDFWFICPRLNLLRGDGALCDGRTTSWDCLNCKLWDSTLFRRFGSILPERLMAPSLSGLSKKPQLSRIRGFRGMALDMDDRKSYLEKMIAAADFVSAPSASLRDVFEAAGVSKPIEVIQSGHDLDWLENMPQKEQATLIRIGYIGQVIPTKGVHILLTAFLSADLEGRAQLDIFGDQNKAPDYMRQLDTLKDGNSAFIKFHGAFPHERLGEILSKIDVLVVPSQWHENNPRVIQEAFASKTPVLGSNVGGISEFVQHEVNGLLFERSDVVDLASQLTRVVDEPDFLSCLQIGISPVKTIDQEVTELETVYDDLTVCR